MEDNKADGFILNIIDMLVISKPQWLGAFYTLIEQMQKKGRLASFVKKTSIDLMTKEGARKPIYRVWIIRFFTKLFCTKRGVHFIFKQLDRLLTPVFLQALLSVLSEEDINALGLALTKLTTVDINTDKTRLFENYPIFKRVIDKLTTHFKSICEQLKSAPWRYLKKLYPGNGFFHPISFFIRLCFFLYIKYFIHTESLAVFISETINSVFKKAVTKNNPINLYGFDHKMINVIFTSSEIQLKRAITTFILALKPVFFNGLKNILQDNGARRVFIQYGLNSTFLYSNWLARGVSRLVNVQVSEEDVSMLTDSVDKWLNADVVDKLVDGLFNEIKAADLHQLLCFFFQEKIAFIMDMNVKMNFLHYVKIQSIMCHVVFFLFKQIKPLTTPPDKIAKSIFSSSMALQQGVKIYLSFFFSLKLEELFKMVHLDIESNVLDKSLVLVVMHLILFKQQLKKIVDGGCDSYRQENIKAQATLLFQSLNTINSEKKLRLFKSNCPQQKNVFIHLAALAKTENSVLRQCNQIDQKSGEVLFKKTGKLEALLRCYMKAQMIVLGKEDTTTRINMALKEKMNECTKGLQEKKSPQENEVDINNLDEVEEAMCVLSMADTPSIEANL